MTKPKPQSTHPFRRPVSVKAKEAFSQPKPEAQGPFSVVCAVAYDEPCNAYHVFRDNTYIPPHELATILNYPIRTAARRDALLEISRAMLYCLENNNESLDPIQHRGWAARFRAALKLAEPEATLATILNDPVRTAAPE